MRSASEFHRRSVENLRRRWRFVFQSPAAKRFGAITARSSAGRRGAEEVGALQGQIQAFQIELENPSHALALLRPRRERPRRRTTKQRYERAPFHCPMPPVLRTERIAYLPTAGDCCAAGFQSGLRRLGVKLGHSAMSAHCPGCPKADMAAMRAAKAGFKNPVTIPRCRVVRPV